MKDHSAASSAFEVGRSVRVVDAVIKAGINLKGRQGKILETWEKCNVDPTCCCAEQVNEDMAIRVEFPGTEEDENANDGTGFDFYFAEEELECLVNNENKKNPQQTQLPFDGLSCVAFKMDQLRIDQ
eukprot:CAMPEP_0198145412 /NCGR_PEP_ID=MMETSP1443-20131203/23300_1 /TAXON_ID=186043 /ORGANISM="Entomoneis sp., Strain CCMP2396" /LENGTH=126 /DNA_ID=CAMNT_0043809055 /DNA_START=167 /DNA_END=547 /DNA_ORIENTATION=+